MKGIIGAIAGDIIGSCYEFNSIKHKEFPLFSKSSIFTDDTVMTLAIADWLIEDKTSQRERALKEVELGLLTPDEYRAMYYPELGDIKEEAM